jgi:hypothetical protein
VLLVSGECDGLFCGITLGCTSTATVLAHETPYFAAASSLDLYMVPDTAHDVALHPSARTSFDVINQWLAAKG